MPASGIGLSGGGVTGLLAATCLLQSLENAFQNFSSSDVVFSTTSGGSIGFGVYANANESMYFPPYDPNVSYTAASAMLTSEERPIWFGSADAYLLLNPPTKKAVDHLTTTTTTTTAKNGRGGRPGGEAGDRGGPEPQSSGWWAEVMDACLWLGYGVHDYDVSPGPRPWLVNAALLEKAACPIATDADTGVYPKAGKHLQLAVIDMADGSVFTPNNYSLEAHMPPSTLEAMAYSSAFWAAPIVESPLEYLALSHELMETQLQGPVAAPPPTAPLSTPSSTAAASPASRTKTKTKKGGAFYWMDGGMVDTTGIVALLQRQAPGVVSFYDNNEDLGSLASPFAYLFGVGGVPTDAMNHLEGPALGQVFANGPALYAAVMANLTDPSILRATLRDVGVLANPYLGLVSPYTLRRLVVVSSQYSDDFVGSFADPAIAAGLDPAFPASFPMALPVLDANALCMFQDFKVRKYQGEIADALGLLARVH